MNPNTMIICFSEGETPARAIAESLSIDYATIATKKFPDGESLVRLPLPLKKNLIIYRSLDRPNDKIIELIMACDAARAKGVEHICLVTPYLAYMRQDIENQPGEAISQTIIGKLLSNYIDEIITVDPHLHRVTSLNQNYHLHTAIALSATQQIGEYIAEHYKGAIILGPDAESEQWVSAAAEIAETDFVVANKVRHGDREVHITLPQRDYKGKDIVLVDDIISTGGTFISIAKLLKQQGAEIKACIVTHCLCSELDEQKVLEAGIPSIISTDSVPHHSNRIALTELLADSIRQIH